MKKYVNFCRALENLEKGAERTPPYDVVEQTGIAALFTICFEQSWKLMKAVLEDHGRSEGKIGSPRMIVKLAYQCGMINNWEAWLDILEARNLLAHTYSREQSLAVIEKIKSDYLHLFQTLKAELEKRWL